MERVEARNALESYLYATRNSVLEGEKKDIIVGEDRTTIENTVKEGLEWMDTNREASADELKAQQSKYEEVIKPILMKLYAAHAGKTDPVATEAPSSEGPRVEEVD
jgi:hypothetical protein